MADLHIGKLIKARAKKIRMGTTELGKLLNTSKQNVDGIYKRRTINTGQLQNISVALDYDFFALYVNDDLGDDLSKLKKDVEALKKEIAGLK